MPFGFGAKKKDEKPPPAAPQASTNYAPPGAKKADPAPPANGGADDLFGGMTQTVQRRRGKTGKGKKGGGDDGASIDDTASIVSSVIEPSVPKSGSVDPAETAESHHSPGDAESNAGSVGGGGGEKKPFTAAKFNFGGDDDTTGGDNGFEVEDAETSALRARLEKFYAKYNPTKLSKLDDTIKAYKGKETKLFTSLVVKYGPEPGDEVVGSGGGGVETGGWGSTSQASGKKDPETASAWGDVSATGGGGGEAWGSTDDVAKSGGGDATSFGENGGFGDAPADGAGGGFGFGDDSKGEGGGGGFGFDDEGEKGTSGFGFAENDAAETEGGAAKSSGFGFGDSSAAPDDGGSGGFGFGNGDDAVKNDTAAVEDKSDEAAQSDEEEDDEDIPLWEQHRREISSAASYLTEKQGDVAKVISDLATNIAARHQKQKVANQTEAAQEAAVARDDFEEAGQLDEELQAIKDEITATDAQCDLLPASIAEEEEGLESAFLDLASLAEQQGLSLKNNLADEERKVDKYITETTSRVGQSADKVAADLEKATRSMNNIEQEVVNLEQRKSKVVEKNETATAGLRKSRDELATSKKTVEDEIRELEQKLAQKRRLLAERKMELGDVEAKLNVIMQNHEENLKDVEEQMAEENKKLEKSAATVSSLTAQEEAVSREKADLVIEAERLNTQLATQREKMHTSAEVAESIRQRGLVSLQDYYRTTLSEVLKLRQEGKGFLCATPSSFPELAKITNALAALDIEIQQESSLQSTSTTRLQEISKSLPVLEAAKKSAALAKQFKDASAKTAEIKSLNDEKVNIEAELATSLEKSAVLAQSEADLQAKKTAEEKLMAKKMEGFVLGYFKVLQLAIATAPSGTGVQKWVDTISGSEEEGASEHTDALAEATINLLKVLDEECRATPVNLDKVGPGSPPASAQSSPVAATKAELPVTNGGADPAQAEAEEEEPEQEEKEEEEVEVEEPVRSRADIEKEIAALEVDIESAMEADDYDQCDMCQTLVDKLKAQLETMQE